MKKHLCLLLCFLLLFCSACVKEELPQAPQTDIPPEPEEEFVSELSADSFYTADGYTYNTYFTVTLTTKELTAPVTALSYEYKNDSDYFAQIWTRKWAKWEDGQWQSYTEYTDWYMDPEERLIGIYDFSPHASITGTEGFGIPLEAGIYRLRSKIKLTNEKVKDGSLLLVPGMMCFVQTYFTILPAPET